MTLWEVWILWKRRTGIGILHLQGHLDLLLQQPHSQLIETVIRISLTVHTFRGDLACSDRKLLQSVDDLNPRKMKTSSG